MYFLFQVFLTISWLHLFVAHCYQVKELTFLYLGLYLFISSSTKLCQNLRLTPLQYHSKLKTFYRSFRLRNAHIQPVGMTAWTYQLSFRFVCSALLCLHHRWKKCWRHSLFRSIHQWVRESVRPKNLVNTISQKPIKGISLNFGHRCIRLIAVLISFGSQRSRSQQTMIWKPCEHRISKSS